MISTADFQHALHLVEATKASKDAYCEKPFAETMDDANAAYRTGMRAVYDPETQHIMTGDKVFKY